MITARNLAASDAAAREYLPTRRADVDALMAQDLTSLPYVMVIGLPDRQVLVGDVVCVSPLAAVAYILARYW